MDTNNNKTGNSNVTKVFLGSILTALAFVAIPIVTGMNGGQEVDPAAVFKTFVTIVGAVVAFGLAINVLFFSSEQKFISQKRNDIRQITASHNKQIKELKKQYTDERKLNQGMSASALKKKFSNRYNYVWKNYNTERRNYHEAWLKAHPSLRIIRSFWGWVVILGFIGAVYSCSYSIDNDETETSPTTKTAWNAENIPMPHLEDATRYVVNPDNVLTENTVQQLDRIFKKMDDSLQIESVVIVVNHIQNDDPFRMAQDVGNKYGVGRGDRGLMIVVGYQDHSINMSPGRSLEADLTDVECYQLQQRYAVPAFKAQQPDSAMIYLAEGVYALLEGKEMPVMSEQRSPEDEDDWILLYMGFFSLWFILAAILEYRHEWLGAYASMALISNPFLETTSTFVSTGGYRGRSSGGFGGGFGGGSFGGGSFGGGGATSRW